MVKPYHLLFAGAVSAQLLFGDQNKEYAGEGKYVTIYNENNGYKGNNYGASALDSNGDTTTWAVMPTRLNENGTKYDSGYTATMTVGPTTLLFSYTEARTYTDVSFTFAEWCSFSGTTTAVCTSSMGGMPKPCDAGMRPGEGYPGGTWVQTITNDPSVDMRSIDFQVYEVVMKTTSIKDTDPVPTILSSGPLPEEWSEPYTGTIPLPTYACPASSTGNNASPSSSATSSSFGITASPAISSSSLVNATPTTSTTGGQGKRTAPLMLTIFVASFSLMVL